jgi:hypothetical protein
MSGWSKVSSAVSLRIVGSFGGELPSISSGKLAPSIHYNVGSAQNSGNVRLSPDESVLFVVNNSSGQVTAAFFDNTTGIVRPGCTSPTLKGFYSRFIFAGNLGLQLATGKGGTLYVPEYGTQSYVGMLQFTPNGTTCTLTEAPNSPVADPDRSSAVLSLAAYSAAQ